MKYSDIMFPHLNKGIFFQRGPSFLVGMAAKPGPCPDLELHVCAFPGQASALLFSSNPWPENRSGDGAAGLPEIQALEGSRKSF